MAIIRLGLIGYPVNHSLSPKIQNAALKVSGLEGEYSLFPIEPGDMQALKGLLERVRSGEITGLNVTIPHKQNVISFMDELTPVAQTIGAVNIIYVREGKLIGDNTDAPGFLIDLNRFLTLECDSLPPHNQEQLPALQKNALVLGAGGSARSVVYVLCNDGWHVTLAARRLEQAQALASQFECIDVMELNLQTCQLSNLQLIVNTTPIGMTPNIDQSPLPENIPLSKHTKIYDLVYNPHETKLVKDARARGLSATTGLGMLIEQAALGFELWTGNKLPSEVFRNAIE